MFWLIVTTILVVAVILYFIERYRNKIKEKIETEAKKVETEVINEADKVEAEIVNEVKEIKEKFSLKNGFKKIDFVIHFILRHSLLFGLMIIAYFLFENAIADFIQKIIYPVSLFAAMAIVYANIAMFSFTKIKFTDYFKKDSQYSVEEKIAVLRFAGYIFVGVCLVVGLAIVGIWHATFIGNTIPK
jgi:hypothetical protein